MRHLRSLCRMSVVMVNAFSSTVRHTGFRNIMKQHRKAQHLIRSDRAHRMDRVLTYRIDGRGFLCSSSIIASNSGQENHLEIPVSYTVRISSGCAETRSLTSSVCMRSALIRERFGASEMIAPLVFSSIENPELCGEAHRAKHP